MRIQERTSRQERRQRRGRGRLVRLAILLTGLTVLAGLFHRFLFLNNFWVVEPGLVYRSGQPKGDLDQTIRTHRLATVLNLRGGSRNDWWYADEVRACRAQGVEFYDLPLSASRRPERRELLQLLDLLDRCEYPVLIHCKSGSDRTGLAAALYALSVRGRPPEQAHEGFSIWYGHVPLFGPERLHEPLNEYAAWLDARALPHTPARFRGWVERHYRSGDPNDDIAELPPPLRPGPRAELAAEDERLLSTPRR